MTLSKNWRRPDDRGRKATDSQLVPLREVSPVKISEDDAVFIDGAAAGDQGGHDHIGLGGAGNSLTDEQFIAELRKISEPSPSANNIISLPSVSDPLPTNPTAQMTNPFDIPPNHRLRAAQSALVQLYGETGLMGVTQKCETKP